MFFGANYIPQEVPLAEQEFNPNYEQDFYNEFYNIFWLAESEIEFNCRLTNLLEVEYELDIKRKAPWEPEEKGPTLLDRIKDMGEAIIKWVREACIRIAKFCKDTYERIRDNTLRDKAMQKIFKNFKYEDLEKAKEKGWKGIPVNLGIPAKAELSDSDIYESYKFWERGGFGASLDKAFGGSGQLKEDELDKLLHEMETDYNIEKAEENYKSIMRIITDRKKNFTLKFVPGVDGKAKAYRVNPNELNQKNNKYYYPDKQKIAVIQDIVFNSQKQVVDMRKDFEDKIGGITRDMIKKDKSDLNKVRFQKDESDNQGGTIYKLWLKSKIAIASWKLNLAKDILKETIESVNIVFRYGFTVFSYIVSSIKGYLFVDDIKSKTTKTDGKKAEPEPEPQAASYIDYGAQFVIECGLVY